MSYIREKFERKQVPRFSQRFSNHGSPRLYEWVADTSKALSTSITFVS